MPYLCVEHEVLIQFVTVGAAILFLTGMFILIICLICKNKARKQHEMIELTKRRLREEEDLVGTETLERGGDYGELVEEGLAEDL